MLFQDGRVSDHLQAQGRLASDAIIPRVQVTTPPSGIPVTLEEIKAYLRIDGNDDDALLTTTAEAATALVETWTGRHLLNRTLAVWLDDTPPSDRYELPYSPARSVDSVSSFVEDGTETTLSSAAYYADTISEPPRIVLNDGFTWPTGDLRNANAMKIVYQTGYGTAETNTIPGGLKEAIKALVAYYYEGRGEVKLDAGFTTIDQAPPLVKGLLQPFALPRFDA